MKVLVDAMYDGWDDKLRKHGYDAHSVKKLQKEEEKLGHDFNVIHFAQDKKMVLVTADRENGRACMANRFPCIFINEESIFEKIVLTGLKELKMQ